jgi:predicted metal-dependent hydrolase
MSSTHIINYGSKQINFDLTFVNRVTLGIKVHPTGEVKVIAPLDAQMEDIKYKVHKKAAWILKHQKGFFKYNPRTPERKYINGETHLYLGRQYLLNIQVAKKGEPTNFVKISRGKMIVAIAKNNITEIEQIINAYYEQRAKIIFQDLLEQAKPLHNAFNKQDLKLVIKPLSKRWGSCTQSGKITLNADLIKAPKACIEYIIIHELCHLVHFNHNKQFYALLEKLYPNWQKWKEKLEMIMV